MQDQLKTLDRVVGLARAATPRRDEPRDAVFEAPAPPPPTTLKTLKHIQAQLADAQAARNEEAASRETAVKELAAELEVLKREKKESAWTSTSWARREDAAGTLRLSIEPSPSGSRDLAAAEARAAKAQEDKAAADEDRDDAASRLEALSAPADPAKALVDRSRASGGARPRARTALADLNRDRDAALAGERARARSSRRARPTRDARGARRAVLEPPAEIAHLARDGEGDKRRATLVTVLRDALLKTQAEDVERARTALARTRDLSRPATPHAGRPTPTRRLRHREYEDSASRPTAFDDACNRSHPRPRGLGGAARRLRRRAAAGDASSRAIVFFDALAFDPTDLVVNDACPALAEHLRIDPSTPCTILGDGDSRSAAARFGVRRARRARWLRLPRRRRRHARRRGGGPDIFAETAQRLAARSNVARARRSVGRRPTPESQVAFARSDPAALMSLRLRGWTSRRWPHLQRVRRGRRRDAEPAWLANKRAVLVSDLYAYVRTVCRGVLVDLGAAERAGIVFRGGSPPHEWVMVASTAFSVAPEEAEIDKGEELRLFRRLATELHLAPPRAAAAARARARGELQRDLAAQQLVDDLHAWLPGRAARRCRARTSCSSTARSRAKGGGQGSGIKHAIVRFGGAKLLGRDAGARRYDRLRARRRRGPGPPLPPAYAPFAAPPPFAPPPPPPPSPPGLADDDAALLAWRAFRLAIGDDEVEAFATPVKGSPPPSETSTAASSSESSFASASWPWARAALTPIPAPAAPGLSRLQPPTTPWDQAAERYRPLDVGFAPFRLPAPSREEPCPT
ncbi:alpha-methylacyl-CoA racemase [Aureococcus anophagefferens]|nr:alpha-methylacyl-CoA racemase [Aureococcus anophagefferens]